jgi:hypothetical protein
MGIDRNCEPMVTAVFKNGANRFLGVSQRHFFRVALGHDLGKCWNKDGKSAAFLRLKDD